MSARFNHRLDSSGDVELVVEFTTNGPEVTDYSLVLVTRRGEGLVTVRVYDGTHGFNEMHRHTRSGGKQAAIHFHAGTLGEGMRAAMGEIKQRYTQMIEGWERS